MLKTKQLKTGRKGLAIGAVLGLVALLAVLGAVLANSMGSSTNSQTTTQQDKLLASSIMIQAGNIKEGMDLMAANTGYSVKQIKLDSNTSTGLFGVNGTLEDLKPPAAAFKEGETIKSWWDPSMSACNTDYNGDTVGDCVITMGAVTDGVCTAINVAMGLGTADIVRADNTSTMVCLKDGGEGNVYKITLNGGQNF